MSTIPTRSFDTIVSNLSAGMQGRVSSFLNFAVGSVLRAISEAVAGILLWFQGLALAILKLTRLATSYGDDVDSWLADWGLTTRIGAVPATGLVVFSRFTPSGSAPTIQVGAQVKTQDGSQTFLVYADTTNPAYSASANGYVLPAQVASVSVPVQAVNSGAQGNISAGAISLISSAVAGVDKVTNPSPFTNGSDKEEDGAVKDRFRLDISSLSKGTPDAIKASIKRLRTGLQVNVLDGQDPDGSGDPGMVSVFVDDGSGNISTTLLEQARAAAYGVRAAGVRLGVFAATTGPVTVSLLVNVASGYYKPTVLAQVSAAIALYINGRGLGNDLPYFSVGSAALGVKGVTGIENLLVNGLAADLEASPGVTLKCVGVVPS